MVRRAYGLVAVLTAAAWCTAGRGADPVSAPPAPASPPAALLGSPGPAAAPPPAPPGPYGSFDQPAPCPPYQDCNGRLLWGDPLLDPACGGNLGWFGDVEVDVVGPHIKNRVTGVLDLGLGAGPQVIHLPTAELDWTAAPRFEIGYRLGQGFGEFLLDYRFLTTDGDAGLPGFAGNFGELHSRLNLNVADLDYGSREFSLGPQFDMKWRIGVRFASIFFDSQAVGPGLEERTSGSFSGVGPHAVLDLAWHRQELPEFALFGRVEGAAAMGEVNENFAQTIRSAAGPLAGAALHEESEQAVPILHLQAGLRYCPDWGDRQVRFVAGYDFEQWWQIGVGPTFSTSPGHSAFTGNGVFIRTEFNY